MKPYLLLVLVMNKYHKEFNMLNIKKFKPDNKKINQSMMYRTESVMGIKWEISKIKIIITAIESRKKIEEN